VRLGVTPEINAISTLIIGFVAALLIVALLVRRLFRTS
jgi:ABC-type spermidine/putrescine transport system permease subunit II